MATRDYTRPITLDRLITIGGGGGGGGGGGNPVYRYDDSVGSPFFLTGDGSNGAYLIYGTGRRLGLAPVDADGATIVAPSVGDSIIINGSITRTLTTVDTGPPLQLWWGTGLSNTSSLENGITVSFSSRSDQNNNPNPNPVATPLWAARRDFTGRETLEQTGGAQNVDLTRLIVRAGPDFEIGGRLTDDKGVDRQIVGVSEIGRGQYVELIAKILGG